MSSTTTLKAILVGVDKSMSSTFGKAGKKAGVLGGAMSALKGPAIAAGVATAGAGLAAVKMASTFESSMQKIHGLVGVSQDQVNAWKDDVLDLAKVLPQSPQELAEGMFFVTSAGFRGAEALDVLKTSARAAAAGLGETETVADAVTSAVNAYGIENLSAADAADVLTATVREGKAAADEIAPVLGNLLPLTSELGVGFDQVGASIAAMTRTGTDAATAATNTQAILTGLMKGSKAGAKALDEVGLSYKGIRQEVKEKGLFAALTSLRSAFKGNEDELIKVIPNVRALRGFLSLTGKSAKENAAIFDSLASSTGAADAAFESASETADFKFKAALSSLQAIAVKIGLQLLPIVKQLADWFSNKAAPAIEKFADEFIRGEGAGGEFRDALVELVSTLKQVAKFVRDNRSALATMAKVIGGVVMAAILLMTANWKILIGAFRLGGRVFRAIYNTAIGPVLSMILGGIAKVASGLASMLRALSRVPGFGWARTAADRLDGAAGAASRFASQVRSIPSHKSVTVSFKAQNMGGMVNGVRYNAGQRHGGGDVRAGLPYLVGEHGAELVYPKRNAHVLPARQTAQMLRRDGGGSPGSSGDDRPVLVQFMLDGRVIQQSLLKRQRETGNLGFVPA